MGDGYIELLQAHRRLLREAFGANNGYEVDTEGDSFFVAFASASDAVAAAAAAQRALADHPWPPGCAIRVRMGLHTGEPRLLDGNYVGLDVHRAAR
jgi:class 3 adenylate cyclase